MQVSYELTVLAATHALVVLAAAAGGWLLVERSAAQTGTADMRLGLGHAVPGADSGLDGTAGDAEEEAHAAGRLGERRGDARTVV